MGYTHYFWAFLMAFKAAIASDKDVSSPLVSFTVDDEEDFTSSDKILDNTSYFCEIKTERDNPTYPKPIIDTFIKINNHEEVYL